MCNNSQGCVKFVMAQAQENPPQKRTPPHHHQHPPHLQQQQPRISNRSYEPNRPNYKKAINNFGVKDLRELLNKKHQETDDVHSVPPPDPQYGYLKDPAREVTDPEGNGELNVNFQRTRRFHNKERNHYENRPPPDNRPPFRGASFRGGNTRGRPFHNRPHNQPNPPLGPIQKPVNIRVELSTTTGEHKYTLDESTPLQELKHVPDRPNFRGRGRGGPRKFYNNRGGYNNRFRNNFRQERREDEEQSTSEGAKDENWDGEEASASVEGSIEGAEPEDYEEEYAEGQNEVKEEHHEEDSCISAEIKGDESEKTVEKETEVEKSVEKSEKVVQSEDEKTVEEKTDEVCETASKTDAQDEK